MFDLDKIYKILITVGPLGLILMVLIYMLLNGTISFRYPRPDKKPKRK